MNKVNELVELVQDHSNKLVEFLIHIAEQGEFIRTVKEYLKTVKDPELIQRLKYYIDLAYTPGLRAYLLGELLTAKNNLQRNLNETRSKLGVYILEQKIFLYKHTERLLRTDVIEPITHNMIQIAEFRDKLDISPNSASELYDNISAFEPDFDKITDFLIDLADSNKFIPTIIQYVKMCKSKKAINLLKECINRSYTPGLRSHVIDDFIRARLDLQGELNQLRSNNKIYSMEQELLLYSDAEKMLKSSATSGATHAIMKVIEFTN